MTRLLNTVAFRLAVGYGALVLAAIAVISAVLYFGTVGVLIPEIDSKFFAVSQRLTAHFENRGLAALQQESVVAVLLSLAATRGHTPGKTRQMTKLSPRQPLPHARAPG